MHYSSLVIIKKGQRAKTKIFVHPKDLVKLKNQDENIEPTTYPY